MRRLTIKLFELITELGLAGSLVLSGQPTASLSDKLTELDELQAKIERKQAEKQAEDKERKQAAKEAERKNERKRAQSKIENIRTGAKDERSTNGDRRTERPKQSSVNNNKDRVLNDSGNNRDIASSRLGTFEATFYTAYCSTGCTGVTATGVDVSNTIHHEGLRVIAVDPAVIPLGTRVKVTLADGSSFVASAEDTGGAIKGRRIDVLVASKVEAIEFGRQLVEVEIISEGDR